MCIKNNNWGTQSDPQFFFDGVELFFKINTAIVCCTTLSYALCHLKVMLRELFYCDYNYSNFVVNLIGNGIYCFMLLMLLVTTILCLILP